MPARAPLDVDLEDKLLYGLTPMRLGYVVLALLGTFALWSSTWAVTPVRAAACLMLAMVAATLAWGRWRGRALDGWLSDIAAFLTRTQQVVWDEHWVRRLQVRPLRGVTAPVSAGENGCQEEVHIDTSRAPFPDAAIPTG